jgi:hypothetical protein
MVEKLHTHPQRKLEFPKLSHLNHRVTSPQTFTHNCFAYALGDKSRQWKPDPFGQYYWPPGVPRDTSIGTFTKLLAGFGYHPCNSRRAEKGVEKIALYARGNEVTHLAKMLPNGKWTSKLGDVEDIEHSLDALLGPLYGAPIKFFSQPKK